MSKENAKTFYDEIIAKGDESKWQNKSSAEISEIIAKEGYDFTMDELRDVIKKMVISQELSDDELQMVAGGAMEALGSAGCTDTYYAGKCTDTVEQGSWCGSGDWCEMWDSTYDCVGAAEPCDRFD